MQEVWVHEFLHCQKCNVHALLKAEVWTDGILCILSDLQCDYKCCEQLQKVINKEVIDTKKLITLEFKKQLKSLFMH
jgi:hypothetical protein